MGANVARLIRTDHRRICELLDRLERSRRSPADLQLKVVGELAAHEAASTQELLPFSQARDVGDNARLSETLRGLRLAVAELEDAGAPAPRDIVRRARAMFRTHAEIEENDVVDPLAQVTDVNRLREAGDAYSRRRDATLKAHSQRRDKYRRPTPSRAELYERARRHGIPGRSAMTSKQLAAALKEKP